MRIAVFGMGYVGCVSAACLAAEGNEVVGVDVSQTKVDFINRGVSPIIEEKIPELLAEQVKAGRLRGTTSAAEAVAATDMAFICVGTPSRPNGDLDLSYLVRVSEELGEVLAGLGRHYSLVYRSTMLPGTMKDVIAPILAARCVDVVHLAFHPEFLREGTSVDDFFNPPKTVVGSDGPEVLEQLRQLYGFLDAPFFGTTIPVAEMIKYADNAFHALKIGFANEIGRFCKAFDIDSWAVMDIFSQDTKLNISKYYLLPGFAFGGSCLPKDLRALTYRAKSHDVSIPILSSVLPSNEAQIQDLFARIQAAGRRRVGVLGLTFKQGTDDLRESPTVTLVEMLLGKGYEVRIYDRNVNLARLLGSNREYLELRLPHVSSLLTEDLDEMLKDSELVIVGQKCEEFLERAAALEDNVLVMDLVRAFPPGARKPANYEGISW